jgi:hypothetical protein
MAGALSALQDMHGVVLHPHVPEVWIAHPFSTAPTPFTVRHGARVWWGNCAWCSLGVAALIGGNEVTIQTTLGAEGKPVTIHVDSGRVREELWVHFPIPMIHAWDNVVYTCSTMLVFDSESAINGWCARHALPRGDAQPIQRAYDFSPAFGTAGTWIPTGKSGLLTKHARCSLDLDFMGLCGHYLSPSSVFERSGRLAIGLGSPDSLDQKNQPVEVVLRFLSLHQ